jgi:hypothetical protein
VLHVGLHRLARFHGAETENIGRSSFELRFVTKGLRNVGPVLEVEYRPVEANEMAIRIMLREPAEKGGLIGRLPRA